MNRLEFLKTLGFRGPALMALLASCVNQEDTVIEALSLKNQTGTTPDDTSSPALPYPSGGTLKLNTSAAISSQELNAIKNPRLKIDLTQPASAALLIVGGYLRQNTIVVAQSAAGVLVAASQTCTHQPKKQVVFNKTEFYCTAHGARFGLTGSPLNSIARTSLTIYKVATDGNTVVVY